MGLKDKIPAPYKLRYQLIKRQWRDWQNRNKLNFASATDQKDIFAKKEKVQLSQPIFPSRLFENKLHNIKFGSHQVSRVLIQPGEVFSFWRAVGPPTKKQGFRKGRNLVKGQLKEDYGGGLCQLSGIIHHLALLIGLEVLERFNHSVDIYTDETRFAALGTDATVVYGYKDLRLKNNLDFALQFRFEFNQNGIVAYVVSSQKIITKTLNFKESLQLGRKVIQLTDGEGNLVSQSIYQLQ